MRVLFLSLCAMEDMESQGLYSDLLKEFRAHGHDVLAIAPRERRTGLPTELANCGGIDVLRVAVGNIQKTNLIEKGVSTLALTREFLAALDKRTPGREFDLVIYATPPTTISGLVEAVKKRTGAKAYLLLKDIFPQNSLDLGMLSEGGVKGLVYRYFKVTERKTYEAADWIGCMSPANREYLLAHEPWLDPTRVEVNPNTVAPRDMSGLDAGAFRAKYGLPNDERIFAYGGNLGKPQCVDFLIDVLRLNEAEAVGFFVIAGSGTDRPKLERFFAEAAAQPAPRRVRRDAVRLRRGPDNPRPALHDTQLSFQSPLLHAGGAAHFDGNRRDVRHGPHRRGERLRRGRVERLARGLPGQVPGADRRGGRRHGQALARVPG